MTLQFRFDNSYARLPERFFVRQKPAEAPAPRLLRLNRGLAEALGLDPAALESPEGIEVLAGRRLPEGAEPLAMAYAGHQFGGWSPQLGDGRAILLGEVVGRDGVRRDVQLKGAGRTPFSRGGDGRAALGPVLREHLLGEGMHALGIGSTRALASVLTGERVVRDRVLPGAVLVRVARSHVRVGTFQYFAARGDLEALQALTAYALVRHHPGREGALGLLEGVIAAQAELIADWMAVGFIHGVMNTDNMSVTDETIDYGPCAFMEAHDPATVYSSIDHHGRYAYGNQPRVAQWNLARLAQALLPLIDADEGKAVEVAQAAVDGFAGAFEAAWEARFRAKLGLTTSEPGDRALILALLGAMEAAAADFTLTFRALAGAATGEDGAFRAQLAATPERAEGWLGRWRSRLTAEGRDGAMAAAALRAVNPAAIPRNHMVEEALAAAEAGDLAPFDTLLSVVTRPFDDHPDQPRHLAPARPEEAVRATFCGT